MHSVLFTVNRIEIINVYASHAYARAHKCTSVYTCVRYCYYFMLLICALNNIQAKSAVDHNIVENQCQFSPLERNHFLNFI